MPTDARPRTRAADYDARCARLLAGPGIDLIHLGLGPDGHTRRCSRLAAEPRGGRTGSCVATEDPSGRNPHPRLSVTYPVIDAARTGVFTVAGPEKHEAVSPAPGRRGPAGRPGGGGRDAVARSTPPPSEGRSARERATDRRPRSRRADFDELHRRGPAVPRRARHGRRVTYSPKVFIPLTMLCRDRCGYCTFAKPPARLERPYLTRDEVLAIAEAGARRGLPRGALHPRRAPRAALPRRRRVAARARLRLDGRVPRGDVRRGRCDETGLLPHANAGALLPRRARPAAAGRGQPGDDARDPRRGPRRPPRRAGQGRRPAAWPPWRRPASCRSPSPPGSWSASARPGPTGSRRSRRSRRPTAATATSRR